MLTLHGCRDRMPEDFKHLIWITPVNTRGPGRVLLDNRPPLSRDDPRINDRRTGKVYPPIGEEA